MDNFDLKKYLAENKLLKEDNWNLVAINNHTQVLKDELGDEYEDTNINLGWGVDENELTISSKIYGNPIRIFRTIHDESGDIKDQELYNY